MTNTKNEYMNFIIYFLTILLFTWTVSCSGRPEKKTVNEVPSAAASVEETALKLIKMVSPEENTGFKLKEPVKIILEVVNKNRMPDSVQIFFNSKRVTTLKSEPWVYSVSPDLTVTTGRKSIKAVPFREGRSQSPVSRSMVFYSDMVPRKIGYKVVHSYPHDVHAFTQGLVFDNGTLFESTGQMNESTLREVILPMEEAAGHLPKVVIRDSAVDAVCHGADLAAGGILQLSPHIEKGNIVALETLKGELVAAGESQHKSSEICQISKGIMVDIKKVFMEPGTYPKMWK